MQLIKNIKAGSDPEVFMVDSRGRFVPAFDLLGGSKHNPRPMGKPGFFIQEDNAALEYNVPPSQTVNAFVHNIFEGLDLARKMLPPGLDIKIQPSAYFTAEQLKHPNANAFGCEADKNGWTGKFNKKPRIPKDGLRCVGGHFHIGYDLVDLAGPYATDINAALARRCDIRLGVPSMKLDKDLDRRKLYGKAGAYRDKDYGMEYRVLSSFWLGSKELAAWVYEQAMQAVEDVNSGIQEDKEDKKYVFAAINDNNEKAIDYLFEKYKLAI